MRERKQTLEEELLADSFDEIRMYTYFAESFTALQAG